MTRAPYPPPFRVGDRIEYHGNPWGRWRDDRDPSSVVYVNDGDIGVVIRNRDGLPGTPGDPYPLDGVSVVRFDPDGLDDCAVAFDEDDNGRRHAPKRYRRVPR